MLSKRASAVFFWALTIVAIAGFIWSLIAPKDFSGMQAWFQETVSPLGLWAIAVFILLQALQVVITPVSHYAVGALGGFLYGPYVGGVVNWVGRLIGHSVAFALSKKFGRPLVEKNVDAAMLDKFDRYLAGKNVDGFNTQSLILFLIYFLPLFPDDEISYIAGLTRMRFWTFFVCNLFGHLGGAFSLAYLGSGKVSSDDPIFWLLLVTTLVGALAMIVLGQRSAKAHQQREAA
jgi:uncharacterized membrane protein YdjX (TVP38/TMEM64 family)